MNRLLTKQGADGFEMVRTRTLAPVSGALLICAFVSVLLGYPVATRGQISHETWKQLRPFKKQLEADLDKLPDRKSRLALLQRRAGEQKFDEAVPEVARIGRLSVIAHRMFRVEGGEEGWKLTNELFERILKESSTLEFKLDALRMLANSSDDPKNSIGRYLEIIRLVRAEWKAAGQETRKHRFAMANAHVNAFRIAKSMDDQKRAVSLAEAYVKLNLDIGQDRAGKGVSENMARELERAGKLELAKRLRGRGAL